MRILSKLIPVKVFGWFLLASVCACAALAQGSPEEKKNATSFIDSMAKTVYNLAWPTATYREVSYDGFEPAQGGFDVLVKLSGQSAFDGSDLWLTLAFMFRDGKFYDIRVKDNNAFLVPPFKTTETLATVAIGLAKAYDDEQTKQQARNAAPPQSVYDSSASPSSTPSYTAPPPDSSPSPPLHDQSDQQSVPTEDPNSPTVEGTCINNPTGREINFTYRWGEGDWRQAELEPHRNLEVWWVYKEGGKPSPQLTIRFQDNSTGSGIVHIYNLNRVPTAEPLACEKLANYQFGVDGTNTALYTGAP